MVCSQATTLTSNLNEHWLIVADHALPSLIHTQTRMSYLPMLTRFTTFQLARQFMGMCCAGCTLVRTMLSLSGAPQLCGGSRSQKVWSRRGSCDQTQGKRHEC